MNRSDGDARLLARLEQATSSRSGEPHGADPDDLALREGWNALQLALQSVPHRAPPGLAWRVLEETRRRSAQRRRRRWIAGIAAACGLVALASYTWRAPRSVPVAGRGADAGIADLPVAQTWQSRGEGTRDRTASAQSGIAETAELGEAARDGNSWTEVEAEIAVIEQELESLQTSWRVSPAYLDFVSEQFESFEQELALTQL